LSLFLNYLSYLCYNYAKLYLTIGAIMALLDDIKEVVVEQLSVNPDEVKEDAKFVEDLGADSLDVVELVMALEEKFDIEIPDDEAEKIQTVKDVVDYIESK